jgi:hypothetical protein
VLHKKSRSINSCNRLPLPKHGGLYPSKEKVKQNVVESKKIIERSREQMNIAEIRVCAALFTVARRQLSPAHPSLTPNQDQYPALRPVRFASPHFTPELPHISRARLASSSSRYFILTVTVRFIPRHADDKTQVPSPTTPPRQSQATRI